MSNTFALKEVIDFNVEKFSATGRGDMLFDVNYATDTTVSTKADRLSIRGGQGNYKILDIDHTKDCTFKATLPIVDIKALAVKLGRDVIEGASKAPMKQILNASATNTLTLANAPLTATLKIYLLAGTRDLGIEQTVGAPATTPNTYSISGTTVTLNATTAPTGTKFLVFYDYTTGTKAQSTKITANDFPKFIRITGRGLANDDVTGQLIPVSFDVKKAKVKTDFELTMQGDKATSLDFECDCYTVLDEDNDQTYVNIVKLNDEAY